uniref:Sodium/calcium exchanger membrane region domain-containing protein n=1 Tax=Rhipicephalus microplus TaxID=6941 RepID=A0A6G5ABT7_RHIMP
MFVGLGITADDFLTPSLIVISDSLHLSQNIAGVTFLAFGNGAPDILSSLAGIQQARPELVIGELFGAGIFVTCVVAGSVYLTQDFNVMERPFLRDVIFYISATFWAFTSSTRSESPSPTPLASSCCTSCSSWWSCSAGWSISACPRPTRKRPPWSRPEPSSRRPRDCCRSSRRDSSRLGTFPETVSVAHLRFRIITACVCIRVCT